MIEPREFDRALDSAVSRRLAKLGAAPVDASALEQRLEAAMAEQEQAAGAMPRPIAVWLKRVASVAAMIVLAVLVGFWVSRGGSTAAAAPIELTQLHREMVLATDLEKAATLDAVNALIALQRDDPARRLRLRGRQVQSCCMADVEGELIAAVLMEQHGRAVTFVVARGADFGRAMGTVDQRDGRQYFSHRMHGLHMVMTRHGGDWLCVMADADPRTLTDLAAEVRF